MMDKKNPAIMAGEDRDGVYGKEKQGTPQSYLTSGQKFAANQKSVAPSAAYAADASGLNHFFAVGSEGYTFGCELWPFRPGA